MPSQEEHNNESEVLLTFENLKEVTPSLGGEESSHCCWVLLDEEEKEVEEEEEEDFVELEFETSEAIGVK